MAINFVFRYFGKNLSFFTRNALPIKSLILRLGISNSRTTVRTIETQERAKLERIHKRRQDTIARSKEALKKLRKENLEGLSDTALPKHLDLENKLSKARSISRLLYLYNTSKEGEAMNLSNQITTLRRLGELYGKDRHEREMFEKKTMYKKLLGNIVDAATVSSKELSPKELSAIVTALSRLRVKEEQKYTTFIAEIQSRGIKAFTTDDIGMLCFAFGATKSKKAYSLMREIEIELLQLPIVSCSNSVLSEIAWAFSELDIPANKLLNEVCTEILSRDLSLFHSRDIALIALAFSKCEAHAEQVSKALQDSLYAVIETRKFPTRDLVALTVALLRSNKISVKMFRRLDTVLVSRRDFDEAVSKELLEEFLQLLKASSFDLSETRKIIENVLHPERINSVFDVFFRPRISWKTKVLKQSYFKVY